MGSSSGPNETTQLLIGHLHASIVARPREFEAYTDKQDRLPSEYTRSDDPDLESNRGGRCLLLFYQP